MTDIIYRSTDTLPVGLFKAVSTVGRDVLLHILTWGTPQKQPTQTLEDYLRHHTGMPLSQYKRTFVRINRQKIASDPSCETFDVTLCIAAIRVACLPSLHDVTGVKNIINEQKLEYFVNQLKNVRNRLAHEGLSQPSMTDMQARWETFRAILLGTLFAAFDRYNIQDDRREELVRGTELEYDYLMEAYYYQLWHDGDSL